MMTLALAMLAAAACMLSGCCLHYQKPFFGFLCSCAAMVLTCQTGYGWKQMLINSGKDTALLGFRRYPPVVMIMGLLFVLAAAGMIVHGIAMARKRPRG